MTVVSPARMRERDFRRFSSFIYEQVGIQLPDSKITMLEARLHKRLKKLNLDTFEAYSDFVFSPEGRKAELVHLIDAVTTNKTDFFRESGHFDYLTRKAIPEIIKHRGAVSRSQPLRIWSAGCSSGEEPYTLAMVLSDYASKNRGFSFSILASDVSTRMLEVARRAIYPEERIKDIAMDIRKKYLLRSRDRSRAQIRISPELRSKVTFRRINFIHRDFGITEKMDVIYCRNVMIYFDKPTQQELMLKFHKQLRAGGYLFLGHSESLSGMNVDFTTVGSTVYRKI